MRSDNRENNQIRKVTIKPGYNPNAAGSALIGYGNTKVLCCASIEDNVPAFAAEKGEGWVTAEYAMLPASTGDGSPLGKRKPRERQKADSRSLEIQRLIGRSLRSVLDLSQLKGYTITIDCDVIQADGGTRTASITGAFVALCLAIDKMLVKGLIKRSPVLKALAAVSAGIIDDEICVDLCYSEDSLAQVDMNIVMTEDYELVEIQGTGEKRPFTKHELDAMMKICESAVACLIQAERDALDRSAYVIGDRFHPDILVVATTNKGKLREIKAILKDHFDKIISLKKAGLDDVVTEETGETFFENAMIKAQAIFDRLGCSVLADDSGLVVDALDGAPGVYSARYAGEFANDAQNNEYLLHNMDHEDMSRRAKFVCSMVLLRPNAAPLSTIGVCEGEVLREVRGESGFGYDPLFYVPEQGKTFAEMDADTKNSVSHRAKALSMLLKSLSEEKNNKNVEYGD